MGGVYRIQTFIGFLYFFYIYKAPKLTKNHENKFANSIKMFFPQHM